MAGHKIGSNIGIYRCRKRQSDLDFDFVTCHGLLLKMVCVPPYYPFRPNESGNDMHEYTVNKSTTQGKESW